MATPFSEISEIMYLLMQQSDVYNKMNENIALDTISKYILMGATVDFTVCKKDLEKYTPYKEFSNIITISEDVTSISIDINNVNDNKCKDNVILYINDIIIDMNKYSYIVNDNTIVVEYDFKKDDKVEVINYFEGEFDEDLSYREKYIIALASYLHYLDGKQVIENKMINKLGDKDYSIVRGNTLSEILKTQTKTRDTLRIYLKEYDQNNSEIEDLI